MRFLMVGCCILFGAASAQADVTLAKIFGENMVLQRGTKVPVWGKAAPNEEVTIKIQKQTKTAKADPKGEWRVELDPLEVGGPFEFEASAKNKVLFKNVLVGEVWVCSGQSNMQWALKQTEGSEKAIAESANPLLRINQGSWNVAGPETTPGFSGTGYYFGRDLQKALGVPVGLINRSVGGTSARAWTSKEAISKSEGLKSFDEIQKTNVGGLYEGHIRPLIPFAIRGVTWYQGESDANRPDEYKQLIKTMVNSWRSDWKQGDFPFIYVSLGAIGGPGTAATGWGPIREAQDEALTLPNTAVAQFIDSDSDLHPRKKHIAGARLALAARGLVYGEKIVYQGPTFESLKVEGSQAIVKFKHVGGGLEVNGKALNGFVIAGEDKKFLPAQAKIEGDTVIVTSQDVTRPVAVRYGFASNPQGTLYNKEGLPANPFRTDK